MTLSHPFYVLEAPILMALSTSCHNKFAVHARMLAFHSATWITHSLINLWVWIPTIDQIYQTHLMVPKSSWPLLTSTLAFQAQCIWSFLFSGIKPWQFSWHHLLFPFWMSRTHGHISFILNLILLGQQASVGHQIKFLSLLRHMTQIQSLIKTQWLIYPYA